MTIGVFAAAGVLLLSLGLSARFTFWRPDLDGVPVLMYHYLTDDISGTGLKKLRVRPSAFVRQMDYLHRRGYSTIGFRDYYEHRTEGRALPERPIIITFDDGARDCLTTARDVLSARGYSGVVFAVSEQVGRTNVWDRSKGEPDVRLLSWGELKDLVKAGWEVGSHTRSHAELTRLSDEALREELTGSKADLEKILEHDILTVSYPYGACDERVMEAARAAGYRVGVTTRHGKNTARDNLLELKRIIIKRKDTRLDLALKLKKGRSTL